MIAICLQNKIFSKKLWKKETKSSLKNKLILGEDPKLPNNAP